MRGLESEQDSMYSEKQAMAMSSSASRVRWSPHSNEHKQFFLRINARNHELGLYEVLESVSSSHKEGG